MPRPCIGLRPGRLLPLIAFALLLSSPARHRPTFAAPCVERLIVVATPLVGVPQCLRAAETLSGVLSDAPRVSLRIFGLAPEGTPLFLRPKVRSVGEECFAQTMRSVRAPSTTTFQIVFGASEIRPPKLAALVSEHELANRLPILILRNSSALTSVSMESPALLQACLLRWLKTS